MGDGFLSGVRLETVTTRHQPAPPRPRHDSSNHLPATNRPQQPRPNAVEPPHPTSTKPVIHCIHTKRTSTTG